MTNLKKLSFIILVSQKLQLSVCAYSRVSFSMQNENRIKIFRLKFGCCINYLAGRYAASGWLASFPLQSNNKNTVIESKLQDTRDDEFVHITHYQASLYVQLNSEANFFPKSQWKFKTDVFALLLYHKERFNLPHANFAFSENLKPSD